MSPPLEIAIVAGVASFLGSLLVPTLNYFLTERSKKRDREIGERHKQIDRELSERARQLDFYKVVYPEKVRAALDIMNRAGILFMDVRAHYMGAQDREQASKLGSELDDMLWKAKSYEFILGEELIRLVSEFRMICIRAFLREKEFRDVPAILEGDIWAHEASYKELANAMRRVVHLNTLDDLLLLPNNNAQRPLVETHNEVTS
jgi:hypothetical protein